MDSETAASKALDTLRDNLSDLGNKVSLLEASNRDLKADSERLQKLVDKLEVEGGELCEENEELEEENEYLIAQCEAHGLPVEDRHPCRPLTLEQWNAISSRTMEELAAMPTRN